MLLHMKFHLPMRKLIGFGKRFLDIMGLKVDIEASYKNMKKKEVFDEKKLVFIQIKPKVHLKDLPPSPIYKGHPEKPMVSFHY